MQGSEDATAQPAANPNGPSASLAKALRVSLRPVGRRRLSAIGGVATLTAVADAASAYALFLFSLALAILGEATPPASTPVWLSDLLIADPRRLLLALSAAVLATSLLRGLGRLSLEWLALHSRDTFIIETSERILKGTLRLDAKAFARVPTGDRFHALSRGEERAGIAIVSAIKTSTDAISAAAIVLLMVAVDWVASSIALAGGMVLLLLTRGALRRSNALGHETMVGGRDTWKAVLDALRGYRILVVYRALPSAIRAFQTAVIRATKAARKYGLLAAMIPVVFEVGLAALIILSVFVLIRLPITLADVVPGFLLVMTTSYRLLPSLAGMASNAASLRFTATAIEEVQTLDDEVGRAPPRRTPSANPAGRGLIELRNVSLRLDDGRSLLEDISLDLHGSRRIGIMGPSGTGKTSLLDVILGLRQPDAGEVRHRQTDGPLRFGYVPQDAVMFGGTIYDNVALGAKADESRSKAEQCLRMVGLDPASKEFSLDRIIGDGGSTLSGGERQRISVARALMADPHLLILDEPTSALDPEAEKGLVNMLSGLDAIPMLLVTHREEPLVLCHEVYELSGGVLRLREGPGPSSNP